MEQMNAGKKKRLEMTALMLLGVSVVVLYVTNKYVPFMMDDLWYSTKLYNDEPIRNFADIVKSQIWHYQNWGGRSMAHALLQLILLCGEPVADILNVAAMLILSRMVCALTEGKSLIAKFAVLGMMAGLNANWKMSMFWESGAANYLYMAIFQIAFTICYLREVTEKGQETTNALVIKGLPGISLWIVPLGIIAGWSNENIGPALWIMSVAVMVLLRREKRRIPVWMYLGNLSCLVGSVIMIVAPGNAVRSAQVKDRELGVLWKLFLRSYAECKAALEYLFPTLIILLCLLFLQKCVLHQRIRKKTWLLLGVAVLSFGAMILSPHYPDRAAFGTMMFFIAAGMTMAVDILREKKEWMRPMFLGAVFVWLRGMYFCCEFVAMCWGWIV